MGDWSELRAFKDLSFLSLKKAKNRQIDSKKNKKKHKYICEYVSFCENAYAPRKDMFVEKHVWENDTHICVVFLMGMEISMEHRMINNIINLIIVKHFYHSCWRRINQIYFLVASASCHFCEKAVGIIKNWMMKKMMKH